MTQDKQTPDAVQQTVAGVAQLLLVEKLQLMAEEINRQGVPGVAQICTDAATLIKEQMEEITRLKVGTEPRSLREENERLRAEYEAERQQWETGWQSQGEANAAGYNEARAAMQAELERLRAENEKLLVIARARTHREKGCFCEDCCESEYQTAQEIERLREERDYLLREQQRLLTIWQDEQTMKTMLEKNKARRGKS